MSARSIRRSSHGFALKVLPSLSGDFEISPFVTNLFNKIVLLKRFDSSTYRRLACSIGIINIRYIGAQFEGLSNAYDIDNKVFVQKLKHRVRRRVHPFSALSHCRKTQIRGLYRHRNIGRLTHYTSKWCNIPQRLIATGCLRSSNDRPGAKGPITRCSNGPEGPAVGSALT